MAIEEKDLKAVTDAIAESDGRFAALLTKQEKEIETLGSTTAATAKEIKEAGAKWDQDRADLKGVYEALRARTDELEKKFQRPGWNGGGSGAGAKSLGEQFTDTLEANGGAQLNALRSGAKGSMPLIVEAGMDQFPGFRYPPSGSKASRERKALLTTVADGLIPAMRDSMVEVPRRQLRIRDLLQVIPTTVGNVDFMEAMGFGAETALAVTSITRTSTTATVTTTAAHGLSTDRAHRVQIEGAVQPEYNGYHTVTVTGASTFTFTVDVGATTPATGTILWRNLSRHGAAAVVAEGATKPEAAYKLVKRSAIIETVAHWLKVSRQILADIPNLQATINGELLYGLGFEEERQILYGLGAASNELEGIMNHPRIQTITASTPITKLRLLRSAITKVSVAQYQADGIVIGDEDWEDVETVTGSDGHFIWANVPDGVVDRVWKKPVVVSSSMLMGDALVGAFSLGAVLYDREEANVRFSEHHANLFIENMLALLAEERVGLAVKRPQSFVAVDFGSTV